MGIKLAEIQDEMRGRVMARALWDEMGKIAAEKKPDRPHYGRQYLGQVLGSTAGLAAGAGAGAALGATRKVRGLRIVGGQLMRSAKATRKGGAAIGAALGAVPGAIAGDYLGLRKAYTSAGYKPPTAGQYAGRKGMAIAGGAVLPGAGTIAGEYLTQKHLQKAPGRLKKLKKKNK